MAKQKYKLTEEEILSLVAAKVARAAKHDGRLSKERERVQQYYDGALPKRQSEGNSSYVSSDVYDANEMMKAQLVETFAGGHDIVRFNPMGVEDVSAARVETKYVNHVIYNQNPAADIFNDVIDDALKARNGIVQVYWDNEVVHDEHAFAGMSLTDVQALAVQEDLELEADLDADADELNPTYTGTWRRRIDKSRVVVEVIPPDEYFTETSAKRREDGVRGRCTPKTKASLIADGYERAKVDRISTGTSRHDSAEHLARTEAVDGGLWDADAEQAELEEVDVYETYAKLALKGDGTACLYRIVHADNVLLEINEVESDGYFEFIPLRRPHSQYGNNFSARIIPTQNARTVLTRAILDHTAFTTNPRWQVLQGGLSNPRELLDNRLRGIVNVKRENAIAPLPYSNLNPFVFQTLEMLKANKEENTGISSLSQGLNKDAISSQNSQGLVDNLVTLSQVRQKVIARNFASFLASLFLGVRRLIVQHEKRERVLEIAGEFVNVDPRLWVPDRSVDVSLHVGYGEQEKEAAKYAELWGLLTRDPAAQKFVPVDRQHKLLTDAMTKNGFVNTSEYITTPDKVPEPQPDPLKIKELEIRDKLAEASLITARATEAKVKFDTDLKAQKLEIDNMLATLKAAIAERDADRKDLDIANKVDVGQRELELAETVPDEKKVGVFSPNS